MTRSAAFLLVLVVVALTGGCDRQAAAERDEPATAPAPAPVHDLRHLLDAMNALVGQPHSTAAVASWKNQIEAGTRTTEQYVDSLLAAPAVGEQIAPNLIFGAYLNILNYYVLPSGFILSSTTTAQGKVVHYLREPCDAGDAVEVAPWWDLDAKVLVCPDSYRPEKWTMSPDEHSYRSEMPLSCDSQVGSPEKESAALCGCGPNLIRCLRDEKQYNELHESLAEEVRATTAYVVSRDLPLDTLFTGNETFRDDKAELVYRRRLIGARQDADVASALAGLDAWPEAGSWAAREEAAPGAHAGLLTSPQLLTWLPDRRQRQRGIFEIMWCEGRNSFGATTEKVFELSEESANLAFVHDSWSRLAHTELCTDCHARLDYGFQFFMGYPDSRAATHFVPAEARTGRGPLYGDDIDDPRGETELDPRAFAKLAVAQPEFSECMTEHVVSYVLGTDASADDRRAIREAFAVRHAFRDALEAALLRYVAEYQGAATPAVAAVAATDTAPASAPGLVRIAPELSERLEEHCTDCHSGKTYVPGKTPWGTAYDLSADELPRELLVRAADHVAYGMMPADPDAITAAERRALVELFTDALFEDGEQRARAQHYLLESQPLAAHQIDNALRLVAESAGASSGLRWGSLERAIYPDEASTTPGFIATTSLEALLACDRAGQGEGRALEICLEEALAQSHIVRIPP